MVAQDAYAKSIKMLKEVKKKNIYDNPDFPIELYNSIMENIDLATKSGKFSLNHTYHISECTSISEDIASMEDLGLVSDRLECEGYMVRLRTIRNEEAKLTHTNLSVYWDEPDESIILERSYDDDGDRLYTADNSAS